jgi:parvulin-like peptidyl-prolyl isomerase
MVITKFNRVIRSRLVWLILGGLFAFSLVWFVGPNTSGCSPSANAGPEEGILNGKPVSTRDFALARYFELGMRQNLPDLSDETRERIRQAVWRRLAALEEAKRLGISVTDAELATLIRRAPAFSANGAFDRMQYEAAVRKQYGADVETFEEFIRQNIVLRKLQAMLQSAVWHTPSEVAAKLNNITDEFFIEMAELKRSHLAPPPEASADEAQKYFEDNPERFRVPEKISVRYVAFPIPRAEERPAPTEEAIQAYYDAHSERYSTVETNGTVTPVPIATVKAEIVTNLQAEAAVSTTREQAMEFVLKLQPDRFGNSATFDALAAQRGMAIHTSRFFSATEPLPELKVGLDFTRQAIGLDRTSRDKDVSNPVVGEEAVYVLAAHTNQPSRIPEFSEVKIQASRLAAVRKQEELFKKRCDEIRQSVVAAVAGGSPFDAALKTQGLSVTNVPPFSLYESSEETNSFAYADTVKPAIMTLQKGTVSAVLDAEPDALLVFVRDRKPADPLTAESLRPQLLAGLDNHRGEIVFADWADQLVKGGRLVDKRPSARERADTEP